jgi:ubiquitin carboxyl-terminal hydrolase 36/42
VSTPAHTPTTPRTLKKLGRSLYDGEIDLTWPGRIAQKTKAAGLYNPSMACYANATLQILLHTPPVLHMAMAHVGSKCELELAIER